MYANAPRKDDKKCCSETLNCGSPGKWNVACKYGSHKGQFSGYDAVLEINYE